jgi:hypothetical protein
VSATSFWITAMTSFFIRPAPSETGGNRDSSLNRFLPASSADRKRREDHRP